MAYFRDDSALAIAQRLAFARRLRELLYTRNLSQVVAAERGDITPRLLRLWLSGQVEPTPRILRYFTKANRLPHMELIRLLGWL